MGVYHKVTQFCVNLLYVDTPFGPLIKCYPLLDNTILPRFPLSILDVLATEQGPKNVGARSDLLRYEAVYQFGGIYMDTDSKSVKGFGPTFSHSFVCYSLAPWNMLQNSVFGMGKGSKLLH